jgi:lipooligosaccharide transport system permease protein
MMEENAMTSERNPGVWREMSLNVWKDISSPPRWKRGWMRVWRRNFLYFKATIGTSLFWACIEPVMYLFAVGYGLGGFIGPMEGARYVDFFFPALLCTTAMNISFFESTYASFTKLQHQKTFSTMMLSRLSADEIAIGEIIWGASKGFFSVLAVLIVASFFGLIKSWLILSAILILAVSCLFFSAFGFLMTTVARNYDSFIYVISGVIVPMSLFSGTYFPLARFPQYLKWIAYLSPLTHVVLPVRHLAEGQWDNWEWVHVAVLAVGAILLSVVATSRLRRRLFA